MVVLFGGGGGSGGAGGGFWSRRGRGGVTIRGVPHTLSGDLTTGILRGGTPHFPDSREGPFSDLLG